MTIGQKKDLLRRYHLAWSTADLDNLRSMLNVNCVTHHTDGEDKKSHEFEPEACTTWHQSFANVKVNIQQLLVDDDRVIVHWLLTSSHTKAFMGIDATQKSVGVTGMEINRVEEGKIVEMWRLSDTFGLMQQLDVF